MQRWKEAMQSFKWMDGLFVHPHCIRETASRCALQMEQLLQVLRERRETMASRKKMQTFEEGMQALEELTAKLSDGDLSLDETMKTYEEGMALAEKLAEKLAQCEKRIEQIDLDTAEITSFEEKNHGLS